MLARASSRAAWCLKTLGPSGVWRPRTLRRRPLAAILQAPPPLPGIERHAERDITGRLGFGVAYHGSEGTQALILDPATYELHGDPRGPGRHGRRRSRHRRLTDRAP